MSNFGVPDVPTLATDQQDRLWKLATIDAEQLLSRASALSASRYKSSFEASLELAMMWLRKAVAAQNSHFDDNPQESEHGRHPEARLEAGRG